MILTVIATVFGFSVVMLMLMVRFAPSLNAENKFEAASSQKIQKIQNNHISST